jgi:ADP-dependent NAD(P)H-hydrate dehydratase / NAD(P)H-hydrate epimerase
MFDPLLQPRPRDSNKGRFGHVLVVAGSPGKTGAAAMAGMGALRAGAGLVTVASAESAIPVIASHAAELMTERLEPARIDDLVRNKSLVAIGPGLGTDPATAAFVRELVGRLPQPMVIDADGLNALAAGEWTAGGHTRVLTPHPGEMSRLVRSTVEAVQADRTGVARRFATERAVTLVLKGHRTLIAFPDGRVWINPTGTPAMATGGTGDILTGFISGLLAQFPQQADLAVAAGVYLHGLSGELGAAELGEKPLVATDLLRYLPRALEECARLSHGL